MAGLAVGHGSAIDHDVVRAVIPGSAGQQILIHRIAIGGDADAASGDAVWRVHSDSSAVNFKFGAGQGNFIGTLDHRLAPTTGTNGRGFSSAVVNYLLPVGEGFTLRFFRSNDWDGLYTVGNDPLGNAYNDVTFQSSVRGFVEWSVVPEPASLSLVGLAALAWLRKRRKS